MNIYDDLKNIYNTCNSLTGKGIESTLKYIKSKIPIKIHKVKTGEKVFDWNVPKEWNIKDAYVKDSSGKKIIDLKNHYLHILSYSIPINKTISLIFTSIHYNNYSTFLI